MSNERSDGWYNLQTGIGTTRDKAAMTSFGADVPLTWWTCWALYHFDAVAGKMVDLPIHDAFRNGGCLDVDGDAANAKRIEEAAEVLGLIEKFKEALATERVLGGCALVMVTPDLRDLSARLRDPLPRKAKGLEDVIVMGADRFHALERYTIQNAPRVGLVGEPSVWAGTTIDGRYLQVHESRCIIFSGVNVSKDLRVQRAGWGLSVLQRPYDALMKFASGYSSLTALLADAAQAVFKLKGLWEMVTGKKKDDLTRRMSLVDQMRSTLKAIILDTDEDFTRTVTPFAGIPEAMAELRYLVAAASPDAIPMTKLFGMSPAGMNATGVSDEKNWNKSVAALQVHRFTKPLLRLYQQLGSGLGIAPESIGYKWHPLDEPSRKENAEAAKLEADTDVQYMESGTLTPQEVRLVRFGEQSFDTVIDIAGEMSRRQKDPLQTAEEEIAAGAPPKGGAGSSEPTSSGKVILAPTDIANIVTVNEGRASQGLPPWPDAAQGAMTITAFKALGETSGATIGEAEGQIKAPDVPEAKKPDPAPSPFGAPPAAEPTNDEPAKEPTDAPAEEPPQGA